jgi:hypothetical protein
MASRAAQTSPLPPFSRKEGHHGLRPVLQEKEDFQKGPFRKPRLQEGLSQVQDPFPLGHPGRRPGRRQAEDGVPVLQVGQDGLQGLGKPGQAQSLQGLQPHGAGSPPGLKAKGPGRPALPEPLGHLFPHLPLQHLPQVQKGFQSGLRPGRGRRLRPGKEGLGEGGKVALVKGLVPGLLEGGVGVVDEDVGPEDHEGQGGEEEGPQEVKPGRRVVKGSQKPP